MIARGERHALEGGPDRVDGGDIPESVIELDKRVRLTFHYLGDNLCELRVMLPKPNRVRLTLKEFNNLLDYMYQNGNVREYRAVERVKAYDCADLLLYCTLNHIVVEKHVSYPARVPIPREVALKLTDEGSELCGALKSYLFTLTNNQCAKDCLSDCEHHLRREHKLSYD